MSSWKEYKFSELCDITRGASPRPIHEYMTNDINGMPWVKISDATKSNSRFIENTVEKIKLSGVQKSVEVFDGDLILSNSATPGLPKFMAINACIHDGWMLLRNFKNITKEFAYWLLLNERNNLVKQGTGTVFINLKTDILKNHIVKIPTIEQQNRIVTILNGIEDKIQLNTQINQTLEQIAQAIFKSWFVDFDPVRAKAAALESGKTHAEAELAAMQAISGKTAEELAQMPSESYAELAEIAKAFPSEFGEDGVPMGWEISELGSLMTIKRGGSPRPIKDYISDSGLNWVKISDATAENNPFLFSTKEYIKPEGLSKTVLLKKGNLILSNSATPGLPRFLELDACIHDGWLYFSNIEKLTQEYLYFFFLHIRKDLVAQGNGSVFTNLKTDIVKSQKNIVPNENVMRLFNSQSKKLMVLIRENTYEIIILKEIRDLLLPRLLNGEM